MLSPFHSRLSAKVGPEPLREVSVKAEKSHDPFNDNAQDKVVPCTADCKPATVSTFPTHSNTDRITSFSNESPALSDGENTARQYHTEHRVPPPRPVCLPALAWTEEDAQEHGNTQQQTRFNSGLEPTAALRLSHTLQIGQEQPEASREMNHLAADTGGSHCRKVEFFISPSEPPHYEAIHQTVSLPTSIDALMHAARLTSGVMEDINQNNMHIGNVIEREKKGEGIQWLIVDNKNNNYYYYYYYYY